MGDIRVLDDTLISQIAAGEVIERPASVVKELLENALDAGAQEISIDLEEGGMRRICVQDDGKGMDEQDVKASIERHATSKLKSHDDLFAIGTLGFRGEALASIASVSHMTVTSRTSEGKGHKIDGDSKEVSLTAAQQGTRVQVHDLFYNTPARKKYMRTPGTELRRSSELVQAYALANPKVGFVLRHNGMELINVTRQSTRDRIIDLLGKAIGEKMIPIEDVGDHRLRIDGYVGKPDTARKDRRHQFFFVNGRYITSPALSVALARAYEGMIHGGMQPVAVLRIDINARDIDVNVHPTKREIRFEKESDVFRFVYHAVRNTLKANNLLREVTGRDDSLTTRNTQQRLGIANQDTKPATTEVSQRASVSGVRFKQEKEYSYAINTDDQEILDQSSSYTKSSTKMPSFRVLGLLHKKFIVAETPDDVIFVDFHAAHERINYERLRRRYENDKVRTQELMTPSIHDVDAVLLAVFEERQAMLEELGFIVELFGERSIAVRNVPVILGRQMPAQMALEVLEYAQNAKKQPIEKIKDDIIARMACRMSYMAGDDLTLPEMKRIIDDLHELEIAFSCPHGRPILITMSDKQLDRLFERTI